MAAEQKIVANQSTGVDAAEAAMDRNIRDLLAEFPTLGDVLNSYGIGCVTCAVGTCQLRDIVQYHYLPEDQQRELMGRIAETIDPRGSAAPSPCEEEAVFREIAYSAPMAELVREHVLIKRWLALIPDVVAHIDLNAEADRQLIRDGVDFIRSYADRFHHAKEEDILFKHFDEGQEIIRVMLADHTAGRNHVQGMLAAVDTRDTAKLAEHLLGYRELLSEHIKKEDEILYPWMDRQLSPAHLDELAQEFRRAEGSFAPDMAERFTRFIEGVEENLREGG